MNINDLKIFEAVAATGNFTKAAEMMFTVQSNVTARIKSLEEEFGTQLIDRTSKQIKLTASGKKLVHYSKQINHLIDEAKQELSGQNCIAGRLKIGCIETMLALKIPGIIDHFSKTYPDVELEFKSDMSATLIYDVLNYKLDAAFVVAPLNIPELEQRHVKDDTLVLVTSSEYNAIRDIEDAKSLKIVVFDHGCSYRYRLESWLSSKGIINYRSTTLNTLEGIVNLVEAGLGITLLPVELIKQFYSARKLKTHNIGNGLNTLTTILVYRENFKQTRVLQAFIDLF
jgi:DNA-binding transcriptional LysR family regulator